MQKRWTITTVTTKNEKLVEKSEVVMKKYKHEDIWEAGVDALLTKLDVDNDV